jgi:4-amino-4-deoxy-L-arabinose transferase-like glycosyltransferase
MNDERADRRELLAATVFLCLMLLISWARLPWSDGLWLDEALSAWTVSGGISDTWNRATRFQTQSPLFYLIEWGVVRVFGSSEVSLRAVSIVAALASLWVVAVLAWRLSGKLCVGVYAAGFLLGCDVFQIGSITARPYALATLCALVSILMAYALRERYSGWRALTWSVATVFTWYAHYLFIVVTLGNLFLWARERALLRRMLPWVIGVALACVPGVFHFLQLRERSAGLFFTGLPRARDILDDIVSMPLVVSAILGALLGYIWDARARFDARSKQALLSLFPYIILPPACFGVLVIIAGGAVWLPRYWEWQAGVFAIVVGVTLGCIEGARYRALALMVTAFFVLGRAGLQVWHSEGWDEAGRAAQKHAGAVVLFSGLIEAETMVGKGKPEFEEYLRAPLLTYGRGDDVTVLRLSATDDELRALLAKPVLLVAARKRVGEYRSPERFIEIATTMGRTVTPRIDDSSMITVYDIN